MTVGLRRDDEASSAGLGSGHHSLPQHSLPQHSMMGAQRLGPYRLVHPLGEGGMGVVHLALDPNGRAVAIKVLREHIAHDREARSRLRREVETLTRVQDARVAAVLDADTEGPRPYIVTRFIPGPTLDDVVSQNGPLQGEALLRLGHGLWDALNAIHRAGVIHRDLKPANVILLDGDPVVIDFGIAHVADDIRLTMTGLVMGTPGYLSPEVVEGAPVTEATDWWGWAATLAFAACGAPPFGRGPMDVVLDRVRRGQADLSGVDRRLAPLLQAALSPVPEQRPRADEVVNAMDRYAAGAPATLAIAVDTRTVAPPTRRYPAPALPKVADPEPPTLGGGEQDWLQEWQPAPVVAKAEPSGGSDVQPPDASWEGGAGAPDHRMGRPSRAGTVLAMAMGVLGVVAIWPAVAIALIASWFLLARFTDRVITAAVARRHDRGRRRSDVPVALVASPWHGAVSVVATVLALVPSAVVAVGATFATAAAIATVGGGAAPEPDRSVPLTAGCLLGLLISWWGPGGARLRRGSRSLIRTVVPGTKTTALVVAALVLMGVGLGAWAWVRHGQPDWWPSSVQHLPTILGLSR